MYPAVTARFLTAVRQSHTIATRLDVCQPDGTWLQSVFASDGDVGVDGTRSPRRDCNFTVPDYTGALTPAAGSDLLSNLSGNELRPYRGIQYLDGTSELLPLGVFPIRSCPASRGPSGVVINLGGADRSTTVSRARWTAPYTIAAGTPLETAIAALLTDRMPGIQVNFPSTGNTVGTTATFGLETENDPWADAVGLASSAGWDLYFDVTGVCVMTWPTDPVTAVPVITYLDDYQAVITDANKAWDADKAYNGCVAIAESSTLSPPLSATVWDDDPASPTYYLGPYGRYPEFYSSPMLTTAAQCTAAAQARVAKRRGIAQTITWSQAVNPAHEAGDPVTFASTKLRVPQLTVVLDSFSIPWTAGGSSSVNGRSRQVGA